MPRQGTPQEELEVLATRKVSQGSPPRFRVLLHDDDFTTMDFVVEVLISIFGHDSETATRIMLDVHHQGIGLAGVYVHEIAEAKAAKVIERARQAEFPFLATIEPDEG